MEIDLKLLCLLLPGEIRLISSLEVFWRQKEWARVSLARPVVSWAHHFQVPVTQVFCL